MGKFCVLDLGLPVIALCDQLENFVLAGGGDNGFS